MRFGFQPFDMINDSLGGVIVNFKRFFINQIGASIPQILALSAALGVVSLGVMNFREHLQRGQVQSTIDAEVADFMMAARMGLRSTRGCARTFAGLDSDPPVSGVVPLGTTAITGGEVTNIYDGSRARRVVITSDSTDDANLLGARATDGEGLFRVTGIRLWDVPPGGGTGKVTLFMDRVDRGVLTPRTDFVFTIDGLEVELNVDNEVVACYLKEGSYAHEFCRITGSFVGSSTDADDDGYCKHVVFGSDGQIYTDSPPLDDESELFSFLVDGNQRIRGSLGVGSRDSDLQDSGEAFPRDFGDGAAFVERFVYVGYDGGDSPPELDIEDDSEKIGSMFIANQAHIGAQTEVPSIDDYSMSVRGDVVVGFDAGDFNNYIDDVDSSDDTYDLSSLPPPSGQLISNNGLMIRRSSDPNSYGLKIDYDPTDPDADEDFELIAFGTEVGDRRVFLDARGSPQIRRFMLGDHERQTITNTENGTDLVTVIGMRPNSLSGVDAAFGPSLIIHGVNRSITNNNIRGDTLVEGNFEVRGFISNPSLGYALLGLTQDRGDRSGTAGFNQLAPNIGWIRRQIARTLTPPDSNISDIENMISDFNDEYDLDGTGLREIRRQICELDLQAYSADHPGIPDGPFAGTLLLGGTSGDCQVELSYCSEDGMCNNIEANENVFIGGNLNVERDFDAPSADFISESEMLIEGDLRVEGDYNATWANEHGGIRLEHDVHVPLIIEGDASVDFIQTSSENRSVLHNHMCPFPLVVTGIDSDGYIQCGCRDHWKCNCPNHNPLNVGSGIYCVSGWNWCTGTPSGGADPC